jgi:hypothetical protein
MNAIIFAMNNRPVQSRLFMLGLKRLNRFLDVRAFATLTEKVDLDLCHEFNIECMIVPNNPADKFNAALKMAYEQGAQSFIIMGDDDCLSVAGLHYLIDAIKYHDYAGFKTNGFYDLHTGKAMKHTQPYHVAKLTGAGRIVSRHAIERVCDHVEVEVKKDFQGYTVGQRVTMPRNVAEYLQGYQSHVVIKDYKWQNLWPEGLKRSLDHASEMKLVAHGITPHEIVTEKIHVTDFKATPSDNIWPYSIIEQKCSPVDPDKVLWFLCDEEREYIRSINANKQP